MPPALFVTAMRCIFLCCRQLVVATQVRPWLGSRFRVALLVETRSPVAKSFQMSPRKVVIRDPKQGEPY
jgi:hypothetical protein